MSDVNAHLLAQRIDTVLDILVAGDYHSAIHNLEILKAELLALAADDAEQQNQPKAPWEIRISAMPQPAIWTGCSPYSPLTVMLL